MASLLLSKLTNSKLCMLLAFLEALSITGLLLSHFTGSKFLLWLSLRQPGAGGERAAGKAKAQPAFSPCSYVVTTLMIETEQRMSYQVKGLDV